MRGVQIAWFGATLFGINYIWLRKYREKLEESKNAHEQSFRSCSIQMWFLQETIFTVTSEP